MTILNFDATKVKPGSSFEPIPAAWYLCLITASEQKATKKGDGTYLQITLDVIDGEYKGRKLFDRLNLDNKNAQAVEIARGTLSAICHAINVMQPKDSAELHNRPLLVKVTVRKNQETGELVNEVKGYKAKDAKDAPAAGKAEGAKPAGAGRWKPKRVAAPAPAAVAVAPADDEQDSEGEAGDVGESHE